MNKQCYRIIFNRERGMLMVVSDIAKSYGGTVSSGAGVDSQPVSRSLLARLRPLSFFTSLVLGAVMLVSPVQANIVADANAPGNQQPQIIASSNGTPQVNIQTPSAGGVSRNQYSQFDVNQKGVILNNSRNNVNTELGGFIAGNNNLAGGEARIILNEVNSRNPSQLNGYIEVAGQKAQVVIANPSGITCDGCGFINADRATLTTGKAELNNGHLQGYRVDKGQIKITGKGLDSSRQDYTELIARSVEVNTGIWANDVKVVTGRNQVSRDLTSVQALADDGSDKPTLAIDVAELGGMYAGKIHLIGTEQGVGVRNAGQLGASAGSVVVNADGRISNSGSIQAQQHIQLTSNNSIENNNRLYANGNITANAKENITNQGTVIAQNSVYLEAKKVNSGRNTTVAAGIDNNGQLTQTGNLTIVADDVVLQGQNLAANRFSVQAGHRLDMRDSNNYADHLTIQSSYFDSQRATFRIGNTALSSTLSSDTAYLKGAADIQVGDWLNQSGSLVTDGLLSIQAQTINNAGAKLLGKGLSITANSLSGDGQLLSLADMALTLNTTFTNRNEIIANGHLTFNNAQSIINQHKMSAGQLSLTSQQLTNQLGAELSADRMQLTVTDRLLNHGLIDGGDMVIKTDTLDNLSTGRIYADRLAIQASTLNNLAIDEMAAVIAARNSLNLGVGTLNNYTHSSLVSLGSFTLGGALDENNRATGKAIVINNHSAKLEAMGDMQLNVGILNNVNDDLQTELVKISDTFFNLYCQMNATTCYDVEEVYLEWRSGKRVGYTILHTPDGRASEEFVGYKYTDTLYRTEITHSDPGQILAGGNLIINADTVNNYDSQILAGQTLLINAELNNVSTHGIEQTVTEGIYSHYWKEKIKGSNGKNSYWGREDKSRYHPADKIVDIDLHAGKIEQYQAVNISTVAGSDRETLNTEHISTILPNTQLPDNSLYQIHKNPDSQYLIETDPRFTQYKKWLGSDYMAAMMKSDPNHVMKRLGDGYYEQQLIREQISALTGQRYLGDYQDDTEQYKALMDAGVAYAETFNLQLGIALTPAQMQALTTDMVWLVKQTITLADGSQQQVLVPQVYVVNRPQIATGGALLSGQNVQVKTDGNINSSGTIAGKERVNLIGQDVTNAGQVSADKLSISAINDINNHGSLNGNSAVVLQAGHDINLTSSTHTEERGANSSTVVSQVASVQSKGEIQLDAGHDVNLTAALIANQGGNTQIVAGNDINLNTLSTVQKEYNQIDGDNYRQTEIQQAVGTEIYGQGDITLQAGNRIDIHAGTLSSEQALNLQANDITIGTAEERSTLDAHTKHSSKGGFSTTTVESQYNIDDKLQKGSTLNGNTINLQAKNDLAINGSQVISDQDLTLTAGNNLSITAAEENRYSYQQTITTESGLMSSGGIGVTYGTIDEDLKQTDTSRSYLGSMVGSTGGNVTLKAGQDITVKGSDVIAQQDITATAQNITLESVDEETRYKEEYRRQQTGLTLAITGTASDVYEAAKAVQNAKAQGNDKTTALQSIKAGLTMIQAMQDMELTNKQGDKEASIGIKASVGTQITERKVEQEQHTAIGSGFSAGNNISLTATGDKEGNGGDINIKGSEIKAGNDITLDANQDLNMIASVNTQNSDRKETNYGGSVGIGFSFGGDESGFRVSGSANFSSERENANGSAWSESIVDAGNKLTVKTGNDANLIGAQLKGDSVVANIGNNLNIQSLQDTDNFEYEKLSIAVDGSYGTGASANLNLSMTTMDSNWASVTDQSGIFAGKGGYDIFVGNNTDLKGAVIASTADDKKLNNLDTGTLSFSDITNKADYKVEHVAISVGTGGMTPPTLYQDKDSDSSTTHSAVEQGNITIRDKDGQKQDLDTLSRDTENANNVLGQIFDKQEHLDKIEQIELVKDITQQAIKVAENNDKLKAQRELESKGGPTQGDKDKAKIELDNEVAEKRKTDPNYPDPSDADIYNRAYTNAVTTIYNDSYKTTGMGSDTNKAIGAVGSVLAGVLTGDITGGLAGAGAPYIAEKIKEATYERDGNGKLVLGTDGLPKVDKVANTLAHVILGAATAQLQGGSAVAGGLGAGSGELAANFIYEQMYSDTPKDKLTEDQKNNISMLASIASGIAVASTGEGSYDIVTGVQTGKNAVENNYFGQAIVNAAKAKCGGDADCERQIINEGIDSYNESLKEGAEPQIVVMGVVIGGVALTPGLVAAAESGIAACTANPVLCANQVGIWIAETLGAEAVPAGIAITGIGAGAKLTAEQLTELAALKAIQQKGGIVTSTMVNKVVTGKGNAGNLTNNKDLLGDANKQLDQYVASLSNSKYKPATAIGAVDPLTGKIVTATNGAVPTVIAPELKAYADKLGGLGVKTSCGNTLGRCAEFRAANELLLNNPSLKLSDIQFTQAVRPRTGEAVPRCQNCTNIFGAEK